MPHSQPTSIRELLHDSIRTDGSRQTNAVLPIGDPQGPFDRYLIRTAYAITDDHAEALRQALLRSTHLSLPRMTFVGPDVGQALLTAAPDAHAYMRDRKVRHIFRELEGNLLDIVPRHEGMTLQEYISQGNGLGYDSYDDQKYRDGHRLELMRHLLQHPRQLDMLFDQAAFIGMQDRARTAPDLKAYNIMIGETLTPSLIDAVSPEDCSLHPNEVDAGKQAWRYIKDLHASLYHELCLQSTYANDALSVQEAFRTQLDRSELRAKLNAKNGTLAILHPHWKGFRRIECMQPLCVSDLPKDRAALDGWAEFHKTNAVQAIALDDPPHKLKQALNELYATAITR